MGLDIFKYKRKRKNKDGDLVVSLTDKVIKDFDGVRIAGPFYVRSGEEMRIDLLSQRHYSDPRYDIILLKYNGISNPYTIEVGQVYYVPNLQDVIKKFGKLSSEDVEPVIVEVDNKTKVTKDSTVSTSKEKYNNKINKKKKTTASNGSPVYTISGDSIKFVDPNSNNVVSAVGNVDNLSGNTGTGVNELNILLDLIDTDGNISDYAVNSGDGNISNSTGVNTLLESITNEDGSINKEKLDNLKKYVDGNGSLNDLVDCKESCDNTDPSLCEVCNCKPATSDVLIYKLLKTKYN